MWNKPDSAPLDLTAPSVTVSREREREREVDKEQNIMPPKSQHRKCMPFYGMKG